MTKPTLVGGIPVKSLDFAPSILFACLYASILPLLVYRLTKKGMRTFVLLGTFGFVVERIVLFSLRAVESTTSSDGEGGSNEYMQTTLGLGMAVISNDLLAMMRCLLLASTYATPEDNPSLRASDREQLSQNESERSQRQLELEEKGLQDTWGSTDGREDDVVRRKKYRGRALWMHLTYGAIQGLGAWGNTTAVSQENDDHTLRNQALRYTATALVLVLNLWMLGSVLRWRAYHKWPANIKRAPFLRYLVPLNVLLVIPAIYRLCVMHYTTPLHPMLSVQDKTLFYVFHIVPEWMACVLLCSINVRKEFLTGAYGDGHGPAVETPKDKAKRLERESESFGDWWRRITKK